MTFLLPSPSRKVLPIFALIALGICQGHSAVILEPFNEPLNGVPSSWTVARRGLNTTGIAEIRALSEGDQRLLFQRTGGSSGQASAYYHTEQFGDLEGSVTLRFTGAINPSANSGVVLRAQSMVYQSFNGYYLSLSSEGLGLYLNPVDHNTGSGILLGSTSTLSGTLNGTTDYILTFKIEGDLVEAALWNGTSRYASLTVNLDDPAHSTLQKFDTGYFGLRSGYGSNGMGTYFSDLRLEAQAIPEPGTVMLLLLSGLGVGSASFLRRRC